MGGKPDGKHRSTKKSAPARKAAIKRTQRENAIRAALHDDLRLTWASVALTRRSKGADGEA